MNLSGANILFPPGCLDVSRPGEQLETRESSVNLDVVQRTETERSGPQPLVRRPEPVRGSLRTGPHTKNK